MIVQSTSSHRLVSVKTMAALPEYKDEFSESALRSLIFYAEDRLNSRGEKISGNGLMKFGVIVRLGRKVLIDTGAFDAWLDSHRITSKQPSASSQSAQTRAR